MFSPTDPPIIPEPFALGANYIIQQEVSHTESYTVTSTNALSDRNFSTQEPILPFTPIPILQCPKSSLGSYSNLCFDVKRDNCVNVIVNDVHVSM